MIEHYFILAALIALPIGGVFALFFVCAGDDKKTHHDPDDPIWM